VNFILGSATLLPMSDKNETFLLEEYKALRKEIEIYLTEARSLERSTLAAVGVIWGWLITSHNDDTILWTMPIWITLAAGGTSCLPAGCSRGAGGRLGRRFIMLTAEHLLRKEWFPSQGPLLWRNDAPLR
jgi:hypothetical protein